jgi:phthiodiolone/phenolphthiodiolone dimycocerosates ketoreductase
MSHMPIEVGAPGIVVPPASALVHTAQRNEERGFDAIWWPDHLMGWHAQSLWDTSPLAAVLPNPHIYFDPIAAIAYAAASTKEIKLGTSVTEPVRNHPAQLARTWLTLDHLTNGRAICGIGAGEGENITPYGMSFDRPASRLEDALRVVRLLWENDEPVDYDGPVYTLRDAVCGMGPVIPGRYPPIWVAAHGPRLCRVTGELADGWLPTTLDLDDYEQRWQQVRKGASNAGRDPDELTAGMWSFTVVAPDHESAHRIVSHPMVKAFALALPDSFYQRRGYAHPLGAGTHGFLEYIPSRLSRQEAAKAIDDVPFEVAHDAILHGSPADLAKKIERYAKIGLRHIALWNVTFFADAALIGPSYRWLTEAKDEIKALPFGA